MLAAVGALALQSMLIVGLLSQRRARRQAESESRRNLALAADASRRQTMSALTTSMAHELGQPLSSMIHNAEALQAMVDADRATPDTTDEILTDIRTQGVQAAHIIERHRAMLRSHQLDRKPIDLHAVVRDSQALVAHDLKARQIEAVIDLPPSPCVISGDPVLLQQVLVNLMMNAIDAMAATPPARRSPHDHDHGPGRGRPALGARLRNGPAAENRRHAVHTVRHDETARARGRPDDRADDRRGPWRHHRCAQQWRRGRDVHGHPAAQRQPQEPLGVAGCGMSTLARRPRVLIADDHADLVKAVSRLLAVDCDVVGTVADGSAVLDAASRLRPDVVVVDLNLPNLNGLEACRQITDRHPQMKVIVFTAMNDPDIRQRSFEVRRLGLRVQDGWRWRPAVDRQAPVCRCD